METPVNIRYRNLLLIDFAYDRKQECVLFAFVSSLFPLSKENSPLLIHNQKVKIKKEAKKKKVVYRRQRKTRYILVHNDDKSRGLSSHEGMRRLFERLQLLRFSTTRL